MTGLLCSLFAYLYLRCEYIKTCMRGIFVNTASLLVTHPDYNADGQYTAPVVLFAFLIGLQSCTYSASILCQLGR